MVGMSFAPHLNPALYIPFAVAMSLGPIPGYITAFLGFIYRKQDKKNPPPRYEYPEEENLEVISNCAICEKTIVVGDEYSIFEPCGHSIHQQHLAEWIADNKHCPDCGESINKIAFK